jgi:hypothetical protein
MLETCTSSGVLARFLPLPVVVQKWCCVQLLLLAVDADLLLAGLLLQTWLWLVLHLLASTCSSPPEMICWFLFSWLGLELHLASMVLLVMFVCCSARAVVVLAVVLCETCEHCSPGTTLLVECLAFAGC